MIPATRFAVFPSIRFCLFGSLIGGFALPQNQPILAGMALHGRDESDDAMSMLSVVPSGKSLHPVARGRQVGKRLARITRGLLQGLEQRFGVRIVVTDRRATKRRHDTQVLQAPHRVAPFMGPPLSACSTTVIMTAYL